MVQTVYAVANRRVAKIPKDDEGSRRWLLDAARKHAANWHRLYRHTYETFDIEAIERAPARPEDTEGYLELRDLVRRTGMRLDPVDQEILLRHDLDGESLQEIARWLGLTKSGAHVRLTQARDRFVTAFEHVQRKPDRSRGLLLLPALFIDMVRGLCGSWLEVLHIPRPWRYLERLGSLLRSPLQRVPMLSGPAAAIVLAAACPPEEPPAAPPPVQVAVTAPAPVVANVVVSIAPPPPAPPPPPGRRVARASNHPWRVEPKAATPLEKPPENPPENPPEEPKSPPKNPYDPKEDLAIVNYALACFHYRNYDVALAWIHLHEIRFPNSQLRHEMQALARMIAAVPREGEASQTKLPPLLEPRLHAQNENDSPTFADDVPASSSDAGMDADAAASTDAGTDAGMDAGMDAGVDAVPDGPDKP